MPDDLHRLLDGAPRFRATSRVRAHRLTEARNWRTANGSDLDAAAGDWLLTDADDGSGREWTVAGGVFDRSYARLPDGSYRKTATVEAVRLDAPLDVPTLEGTSVAAAGDWLVRGVDGELWPVDDEHFRTHYTPDTRTVLDEWHDDDPRHVNADMVPPRRRGLEAAAMGSQVRSELLQATYLLVLVASPAATFVLRSVGAADGTTDAVGAILLVAALAIRLGRQYRAPDGSWVRARRDLEEERSRAWRRAVTGAAEAGDSVRCRALGAAGVDERWAAYRRFRIADQVDWMTRRGGEHGRAATRMRWLQGTLAVVALVAAVAQATQLQQTPVVNLVVALLAATEAWSQFRRSAFIASSYTVTAGELRTQQARRPATETELAEVVDTVERLLERELWTWVAISSTAVLTERRRAPAA